MSAAAGTTLFFVVPDAVDDPGRVSGGNRYDRRVREGLRSGGWDVRMILIPDGEGEPAARALSQLPDSGLVLIDGLIAVRESEALLSHSSRLRIVVLAHMISSLHHEAIADPSDVAASVDREREALRAAERVITTSGWTRSELIQRGFADPHRVVVAHPGTDAAAAVTVASASGGRLLCVGVVAPHKGQDLLVGALARLTDFDGWSCEFVGSLDAAPAFVDELKQTVQGAELTARTTFTGILTGSSLEDAYGRADLLVAPSRNESFSMVVAEALAHGIPVLAARVGGIPEALSNAAAGILVPPDDADALEVELRRWWTSPGRRTELKTAASRQAEGTAVRQWSTTIAVISSTLHEVALNERAASA